MMWYGISLHSLEPEAPLRNSIGTLIIYIYIYILQYMWLYIFIELYLSGGLWNKSVTPSCQCIWTYHIYGCHGHPILDTSGRVTCSSTSWICIPPMQFNPPSCHSHMLLAAWPLWFWTSDDPLPPIWFLEHVGLPPDLLVNHCKWILEPPLLVLLQSKSSGWPYLRQMTMYLAQSASEMRRAVLRVEMFFRKYDFSLLRDNFVNLCSWCQPATWHQSEFVYSRGVSAPRTPPLECLGNMAVIARIEQSRWHKSHCALTICALPFSKSHLKFDPENITLFACATACRVLDFRLDPKWSFQ